MSWNTNRCCGFQDSSALHHLWFTDCSASHSLLIHFSFSTMPIFWWPAKLTLAHFWLPEFINLHSRSNASWIYSCAPYPSSLVCLTSIFNFLLEWDCVKHANWTEIHSNVLPLMFLVIIRGRKLNDNEEKQVQILQLPKGSFEFGWIVKEGFIISEPFPPFLFIVSRMNLLLLC